MATIILKVVVSAIAVEAHLVNISIMRDFSHFPNYTPTFTSFLFALAVGVKLVTVQFFLRSARKRDFKTHVYITLDVLLSFLILDLLIYFVWMPLGLLNKLIVKHASYMFRLLNMILGLSKTDSIIITLTEKVFIPVGCFLLELSWATIAMTSSLESASKGRRSFWDGLSIDRATYVVARAHIVPTQPTCTANTSEKYFVQ